jgi:hypothetical protein
MMMMVNSTFETENSFVNFNFNPENSGTEQLVKNLTTLPVKRIFKYHCDLKWVFN